MITIKGTKKEVTAVEISEYSLLAETSRFILSRHNLSTDNFLDEAGNICVEDQYRAGSSYTRVIGKATASEKRALKTVEYLTKLGEST